MSEKDIAGLLGKKDKNEPIYSDTGNRTPGYRVRGDNVSHYTTSDFQRLFPFPYQTMIHS
jgi:hypothetical protein